MKKRTTMVWLLILCLLLGMLAGCGSQASTDTGDGGTPSDTNGGASSGSSDDREEWLRAQVIYYMADGSLEYQMTYRYNSHGDISYYSRQSASGSEMEFSFEYTYLEDGRVSKIYHPEDKYAEVYSWDPTGKTAYISTVYDSGNGYGDDKVKMKAYDDQGRLVEEDTGYGQYYRTYTDTETAVKYYSPTFDETTLTVTKYDKSGRTVEVRRYRASGFIDCTEVNLEDYTLYSYSKKGQCTEHTEYGVDGSMTTKATYTHEADGHSYRITYHDATGNVTGSRYFLYKPAKEVTDQ